MPSFNFSTALLSVISKLSADVMSLSAFLTGNGGAGGATGLPGAAGITSAVGLGVPLPLLEKREQYHLQW